MTNIDPDSAALAKRLKKLASSLKEEKKTKQKEILQAMLGIARGITEHANGTTGNLNGAAEHANGSAGNANGSAEHASRIAPEPNLKKDFKDAFKGMSAEKVDLILSYKEKPPMIVGHPDTLTAYWDNGQGDAAVTPRILRKQAQPKVPPSPAEKEQTGQ